MTDTTGKVRRIRSRHETFWPMPLLRPGPWPLPGWTEPAGYAGAGACPQPPAAATGTHGGAGRLRTAARRQRRSAAADQSSDGPAAGERKPARHRHRRRAHPHRRRPAWPGAGTLAADHLRRCGLLPSRWRYPGRAGERVRHQQEQHPGRGGAVRGLCTERCHLFAPGGPANAARPRSGPAGNDQRHAPRRRRSVFQYTAGARRAGGRPGHGAPR